MGNSVNLSVINILLKPGTHRRYEYGNKFRNIQGVRDLPRGFYQYYWKQIHVGPSQELLVR